MDKNVLDKEEIHDMKIICEQDDATNIFEDLKCGDVFRLSHFKHDTNTYMRVNNAFDNSESCTITLTFDGDKYVIPHWMRAEIIAAIIKENELSIDRLNRQLEHYKNK